MYTNIRWQQRFQNFEKVASLLDQKIYENTEQIQSIARTRDELLPKLMSSEVRVRF